MNKKRLLKYVFVIILIFFSFSRFINLEADRPLCIFATVIDEGYKIQPAKYKALFNTWFDDDSNSGLFLDPFFNVLLFPVYKTIGVSLFSTRILSAIAGIFSILLLYLILRRENKKVAIFSCFLLAINNLFFILNRVGLPESLVLMAVLLSFYIISLNEKKLLNYLIAGFVMGLAFLLKINQIYFMPAIFIFLIMQCLSKKINFKHIFSYFLSYGAIVFAYFVYVNYLLELLGPIMDLLISDNPFYLFLFRPFILFVSYFFSFPSMFFLILPTLTYFIVFGFPSLNWGGFVKYSKSLGFTEKMAFSCLIGTLGGIIFSSLVGRKMSFLFIPFVIYPSLLLFKKNRIKEKIISKINLLSLMFVSILLISVLLNYFVLVDEKVFDSFYDIIKAGSSLGIKGVIIELINNPYFAMMVLLFLVSVSILVFLYLKAKKHNKFKDIFVKLGIFCLISLLVFGFFYFSYIAYIRRTIELPIFIISVLSLFMSIIVYKKIIKKPIKTTKYFLGIYVVYCFIIIISASLLFPSFTVKEANQKIDELTNEGDYIIGYGVHGLSIQSGTRPIYFKFIPPFSESLDYSIYEKFKPKLYLRQPLRKNELPKKEDVPNKLEYIDTFKLNPLLGIGRPREVIEVYRIIYDEESKNNNVFKSSLFFNKFI